MLDCLEDAIIHNNAPKLIRSENGSEVIAKIVKEYFGYVVIKTLYLEAESSWQNGLAGNFNGPFHEECLNRELFYKLKETQTVFTVGVDFIMKSGGISVWD